MVFVKFIFLAEEYLYIPNETSQKYILWIRQWWRDSQVWFEMISNNYFNLYFNLTVWSHFLFFIFFLVFKMGYELIISWSVWRSLSIQSQIILSYFQKWEKNDSFLSKLKFTMLLLIKKISSSSQTSIFYFYLGVSSWKKIFVSLWKAGEEIYSFLTNPSLNMFEEKGRLWISN